MGSVTAVLKADYEEMRKRKRGISLDEDKKSVSIKRINIWL